MATMIKDARYSARKEGTGHADKQWVARFCGDWIGCFETFQEAANACFAHKSARDESLTATRMCDRPLAQAPLVSYRCKSPDFDSWIMIAAKDHEDAMREAHRSNERARREDLQVWNGQHYENAFGDAA